MQWPQMEQVVEQGLRTALAQMLPELRAFARLLAGPPAEADDLLQEALARMLAGLERFEPGTNLRAWAYAVLRNTFREQHRQRRRQVLREGQAMPEPGASGGQEERQELRELSGAIRRLPPAQREALVLVGAQGLSHEEAAAICEVPVGTMKARVSRARSALATMLGHGAPLPVIA
jgi:RNA polymerase sigma-70 factor (ECF subfamily)